MNRCSNVVIDDYDYDDDDDLVKHWIFMYSSWSQCSNAVNDDDDCILVSTLYPWSGHDYSAVMLSMMCSLYPQQKRAYSALHPSK